MSRCPDKDDTHIIDNLEHPNWDHSALLVGYFETQIAGTDWRNIMLLGDATGVGNAGDGVNVGVPNEAAQNKIQLDMSRYCTLAGV